MVQRITVVFLHEIRVIAPVVDEKSLDLNFVILIFDLVLLVELTM